MNAAMAGRIGEQPNQPRHLRFRCDSSATHMQINQGVINEKGRLSRIELDRIIQKHRFRAESESNRLRLKPNA